MATNQKSGLSENGSSFVFFSEMSDLTDRHAYALKSISVATRTRYQDVCIADTVRFGTALFLDGTIQSAEADESLYHELLVQPSMLCHPAPINVLVIGSGEGAVLREVARHNSVQKVTMVDIDGDLIGICKKHLPMWSANSFDDPRTEVIIGDGHKFVSDNLNKYDVIVIDLTDMIYSGIAQALYSESFFRMVRNILMPGGLVAVQALRLSTVEHIEHAALARTVKRVFSQVYSYNGMIPSFLRGWGFLMASDWFSPDRWSARDIDNAIMLRLGGRTEHVNGSYLTSCFSLPNRLRAALDGPGPDIAALKSTIG